MGKKTANIAFCVVVECLWCISVFGSGERLRRCGLAARRNNSAPPPRSAEGSPIDIEYITIIELSTLNSCFAAAQLSSALRPQAEPQPVPSPATTSRAISKIIQRRAVPSQAVLRRMANQLAGIKVLAQSTLLIVVR